MFKKIAFLVCFALIQGVAHADTAQPLGEMALGNYKVGKGAHLFSLTLSTWAEDYLAQGYVRYGGHYYSYQVPMNLSFVSGKPNHFVGQGQIKQTWGNAKWVCYYPISLEAFSYQTEDGGRLLYVKPRIPHSIYSKWAIKELGCPPQDPLVTHLDPNPYTLVK